MYRHAGGSFFKWIFKYDSHYKSQYNNKNKNPFLGHEFDKEEQNEIKAFDAKDIIFLHRESLKKRDESLSNIIKIGAYTGYRIEEICQLKNDDIIIENGVKCFFIKKGKTKSSIRMIPIHHEIEGFVDNLCKKTGESGYLINTTIKNKYGKRSDCHPISFSRLREECNYDKLYVFHSIRKTFITKLQHNNVQPLVIMSLAGHLTSTVTFDRYSAGASVEQKLEAIETLKFDI